MADNYRNPLIADMPGDTINNVHNVISFLSWVESGNFDCDLGDEGACGRMLIYQGVDNAVRSLKSHLAVRGPATLHEVANG